MSSASDLSKLLLTVSTDQFIQQCKDLAGLIMDASRKSKLIVLFGNGGSAADAQHWAGELVCTYSNRERRPYPALALTCDSSIITAWSNDFEFTSIFSRQIHAYSGLIGLAIGLSTSGTSANVLSGLKAAHELGAKTVLISGNKCDESDFATSHVRFPTKETPHIQTLTQVMYHQVCSVLDEES